MYTAICRLEEDAWSKSTFSEELKDILRLSRSLREDRKLWKASSHRNRNRNQNPSDKKCEVCRDLQDSEKCVRYVSVHENDTKDLENKLIIPESDYAISPAV